MTAARSVRVTYRTIEPGPPIDGGPSARMVVRNAEFTGGSVSERSSPTDPPAGYAMADGKLMRFWGGGRALLVPISEILEVSVEE